MLCELCESIQKHRLVNIPGGLVILEALQYFKSEWYGMRSGAAGNDASAGNCRLRIIFRALCNQRILETFEAGEFHILEIIKLAQDQSRSGTDCSQRTAGGIVRLHQLYEVAAAREFLRPRHPSGKYHHVPV